MPVFGAAAAVTILVKIPRVGDESDKSLCGNGLAAESGDYLIEMVKPPPQGNVATAPFFLSGIPRIIGKFSRWR
jgi:hypothetical protein